MKISRTALSQILKEALFDPRKDKKMEIIASQGNSIYFINRAKEELDFYLQYDHSITRLFMAIWLVAVAIWNVRNA